MSTVRNIRIATGVRKIELGNENMAMLQIADVLKEHREMLINSLLSDLSTYVNYKFSVPQKKDRIQAVRGRLLDLRNSSINIARYSLLISEVLERETTHIRSEPFYQEIDEVIGEELNPTQLTLVK